VVFGWGDAPSAPSQRRAVRIRIYKDVRGRPPYIVQSTVGLAAPPMTLNRLPAGRAEAHNHDHCRTRCRPGDETKIYQDRENADRGENRSGRTHASFVATKDAPARSSTPKPTICRRGGGGSCHIAQTPALAVVVVYGHQPRHRRRNMTGASAARPQSRQPVLTEGADGSGGHVAALPERRWRMRRATSLRAMRAYTAVVALVSALVRAGRRISASPGARLPQKTRRRVESRRPLVTDLEHEMPGARGI